MCLYISSLKQLFASGKQEGGGAFSKARPKELERLRPGVSSRPASDTDDTMWEELLQGPDSASTGSSDSDQSGRYNAGMVLPQTVSPSSDDESLKQEITGVRQPKCQVLFLPSSHLVIENFLFTHRCQVHSVMTNAIKLLEITVKIPLHVDSHVFLTSYFCV